MSYAPAIDIVRSSTMMTCIYALCEPTTGEVRYIGKATDPAKRLRAHLSSGQINRYWTRKNAWIKGLLAQGLEPDLQILDQVPTEHANTAEREYIALYRDMNGKRLTNGTLGGDGGAMPPAVAKAAGMKRRGRVQGLQERANRQATLQEFWAKTHPQAAQRRAERSARSIAQGLRPPVHIGEDNPTARFTEAQVIEIRERHAAGENLGVLAAAFGTSKTQISSIVTGTTWRHVGGPIRAVKEKTKLSIEAVEEIRRRLQEGQSQVLIAMDFGVSQTCVSDIKRGKRRKNPNN